MARKRKSSVFEEPNLEHEDEDHEKSELKWRTLQNLAKGKSLYEVKFETLIVTDDPGYVKQLANETWANQEDVSIHGGT